MIAFREAPRVPQDFSPLVPSISRLGLSPGFSGCFSSSSSAPKDAVAFHVQGTPGVKLYVVHETQSIKLPSSVGRWPLAAGAEVLLTMDALSKDVGDEKVGAGGWWRDPAPAQRPASTRCLVAGQDFVFRGGRWGARGQSHAVPHLRG